MEDGGQFSMVNLDDLGRYNTYSTYMPYTCVYSFKVHSGTDYELSSVEVKLETKKAVGESVGVSGGVSLTRELLGLLAK
jgi:hypothetical protein